MCVGPCGVGIFVRSWGAEVDDANIDDEFLSNQHNHIDSVQMHIVYSAVSLYIATGIYSGIILN